MNVAHRCQSCGMPLAEGFYGANKNGSASREYCKRCFQNGAFTEPDLTLEQMMTRSIRHMITEFDFPRPRAEGLARGIIPMLKRWRRK